MRKAIQLWRTTDLLTSLSGITPTRPTSPADAIQEFILEFSPDETLATVARGRENTVTVLDLKSGDPRLIVETGMEIVGLRVTGSVVVVVGQGTVITWVIPPGAARNTRANVDDCVRTTMFNYPGPLDYTSISATLQQPGGDTAVV